MKLINMNGLLYEPITVAQAKEVLKNRKKTHNLMNRDSLFILCDYGEHEIVHDLSDIECFENNKHEAVQIALFKGFVDEENIKNRIPVELHGRLRLWIDTATWTLE